MATNILVNNIDLEDVLVSQDLFGVGVLYGFGDNAYSQLGDNSTTDKSSPVQTLTTGNNWKQVACRHRHSSAIKSDGTLWIWGTNSYGQLGDNSITTRSAPVQTITTGNNWKHVSCGQYHTGAIKTDGTLWIWGFNSYGQLATNNLTNRSSPVQTIATGNNWKQIACGYRHTAAIKMDGTLWTWGFNQYGQLGDNSVTIRSSPVQTVATGNNWKQVACGYGHTVAIKTDGTLWTWGRNAEGILGDNTTTHKSSPAQTITTGTNWKTIATGEYHIVATKTDGTLWTWGEGVHGEHGNNAILNKSSPIQTVATGNNWKQIACGYGHTIATKTDGTLWIWGRNTNGQLGDNTLNSKSSPIQLVAGTNWKYVTAGYYNTFFIINEQ
jgi:alpha-tubulin suppressor-like RCC1 family protein